MNDGSRSIKSYPVSSNDFDELINFDSEDTPFLSNRNVNLTNFAPLLASKRAPSLAAPKEGSGRTLKISQQNSTQKNVLFSSERFSIEKIDEDKYKLIRKPNPIETLVLSGGGAKGLAYPGAIQALAEEGHLSTIRDIHAASIGALAGVLLAAGMTAQEFKELSDQINLMDLISKSKDSHPENGFLKNTQLGLIKTLLANIGTTAPKLREFIDKNVRETIINRINEKEESFKKIPIIENIYEELKKGKNITFKDLEVLNRYIPEIKRFHCTATAYFGSDKPQSAVLSATTTPDLSVSDAACASGALPIIFSKITLKIEDPEKRDDYEFFSQAKWADGGLLMNTPVPSIIHGMGDPSKCLIFVFENDQLNQAMQDEPGNNRYTKKKLFKKAIERGSERVIGAPYKIARDHFNTELSQSPVKESVIIVPLTDKGNNINYSGSRGRLALNMGQKDKNALQDLLYKKTLESSKMRKNKKNEEIFTTTEDFIYSLSDDEFYYLMESNEIHECLPSKKLKYAIHQRIKISNELNNFLNSMHCIFEEKSEESAISEDEINKFIKSYKIAPENINEFIKNKIVEYYFQGLDIINEYNNIKIFFEDKNLENITSSPKLEEERDKLEKIHRYLTLEKILTILNKYPTLLEEINVFNKIIEKIKKIKIKNISKYIIRYLIYPEKNKPIQSNMNVLLEAEKGLNQAKTAEEVIEIVNTLTNKYKLNISIKNLNDKEKIKKSKFLGDLHIYIRKNKLNLAV